MIFAKPFAWYLKFIRNPFFLVSVSLIALEIVGRLPQFIWLNLAVSTPLLWLIKAGAAVVVGYRIGEVDHKVFQSIIGGGMLGAGIGVINSSILIFRRIIMVHPEVFGVFGGFDIFFTGISEIIMAAFFAGIGSVLAGGRLEKI